MTEEMFAAIVTDALTVSAAAEELGISRRTVEIACQDGTLRAVRMRGRFWVHASWVEEYRLWRIRQGRREGAGRAWRKGLKGKKAAREAQDCAPRLGYPPIIAQPSTPSVPVTVISLTDKTSQPSLYKEGPILGRTSLPAMENPKVQPRPKSSWLPKKERQRAEEGRV